MNKDEKDDEKDPELAKWLRLWEPPQTPIRLSERLNASYRSGVRRPPLWKRLPEARINLPLPLAVFVLGLVLGIGILAGRHFPPDRPSGGDDARPLVGGEGGLAHLRPLPEVRLTVLKQGGGSDDWR